MKIAVRCNTDNSNDMLDALNLLGFESLELNFFRRIEDIDKSTQLIIYCELSLDDDVTVTIYKDAEKLSTKNISDPLKLINYIESILKSYGIADVKLVPLDSSTLAAGIPIIAKSTTRDFASNLRRVKSSNVWSYAFNPKDEYVGDMLMQFKNTNGGPGDIYIYYDVPSKLWRQFVAAPSKGHWFWVNIRNNFKYSKLTGDKRTKLKNGI